MSHLAANILVFDSGVGGLSIVSHIRRQLPAAGLTYLADTLFFPYGLMEQRALIDRVTTLISQVVRQYPPDIIVIACNSASTLALPHLRQALDIPIVGVVPAIKPAALHSQSKVIGLLATPGTIQRDYTDDLIGEFATSCNIVRVGSAELVTIVEEKLSGIDHPADVFSQIIAPLRAHAQWPQMDTIVLACTHFPLVQNELANAAPEITHWIDSGDAIARRVQQVLSDPAHSMPIQPRPDTQHNIALFTKAKPDSSALQHYLRDFGFNHTAQWQAP